MVLLSTGLGGPVRPGVVGGLWGATWVEGSGPLAICLLFYISVFMADGQGSSRAERGMNQGHAEVVEEKAWCFTVSAVVSAGPGFCSHTAAD